VPMAWNGKRNKDVELWFKIVFYDWLRRLGSYECADEGTLAPHVFN
jgi:hypothetical protein